MITGALCRYPGLATHASRDLAPVVFVGARDSYAAVGEMRLDANGWLVVEHMNGANPVRIPPHHVNAIYTTFNHDDEQAKV